MPKGWPIIIWDDTWPRKTIAAWSIYAGPNRFLRGLARLTIWTKPDKCFQSQSQMTPGHSEMGRKRIANQLFQRAGRTKCTSGRGLGEVLFDQCSCEIGIAPIAPTSSQQSPQ